MRTGILGEFETPESMLGAIRALRARGYRRIDAFTPYPVHGAEEALGLSRSPLTWLVLPIALLGAATAYIVMWYCNAVDYPINVGGRPGHAAPAFIPVTFEMGVLSASLMGCLLFLALCRLPELYSPIFDVEGFERASIDRFWVGIDARDPSYNPVDLERALAELGASKIAVARERER